MLLSSKVFLAQNRVKYAGKSLEFRLNNPRNFIYKAKKDISVVLIDDIITSGTTIREAIESLEKYNVKVINVITLADAKE